MYRNPELEEIRILLHAAGIKYKLKSKYFEVKCPYHDDHTPSAVIYRDNGYFKCYSCSAQRSFSRLYKDLTNTDWDGKLHLSLTMFDPQHNVALKVLHERQKRKLSVLSQTVFIDGDLCPVNEVPEARAYCGSRSIEDSFLDTFDVKALVSGKVNNVPWKERLIIPFEDEGLIKSVEGRDYTRQQSKKVLYPVNTSVDFLFNRANLDTADTLIVVEGVMDVHKIWQWVTPNVTCVFGISLRENQKETLKEFKDIILFIDDDEAGRKLITTFEEFYPNDFRIASISGGKDPGAGTKQELVNGIQNAVLFNKFLMEDVGVFPNKADLSLSLCTH